MATDTHTEERANTGRLEGRIIFPSVATDKHTGERAKAVVQEVV